MGIVSFIVVTIFGSWLKGKYVNAYRIFRHEKTREREYYKPYEQRVLDKYRFNSHVINQQIGKKPKAKKLSKKELRHLVRMEILDDEIAKKKRDKEVAYDFMMKHHEAYRAEILEQYPEDFKRLFPHDIADTF